MVKKCAITTGLGNLAQPPEAKDVVERAKRRDSKEGDTDILAEEMVRTAVKMATADPEAALSAQATLVIARLALTGFANEGLRYAWNQKIRAKKDRNRDAFSDLLKRTLEGLRAENKRTSLKIVVTSLSRFDDEKILRAPPDIYGNPQDNRRYYFSDQSKVVYWCNKRKGAEDFSEIPYRSISPRLSRLKEKKLR